MLKWCNSFKYQTNQNLRYKNNTDNLNAASLTFVF